MGTFMKACFVHSTVIWDEFILEDRMEERAKERSHIGDRAGVGVGRGGGGESVTDWWG